MVKLTKLFEPGMIGTMEVKNRIVMSPMGTFTADEDGYITDRTIDYYVERAKGGVGLILSQATSILPECATPGRSWLYDDKFIPRHRELSRAIHEHGGKMALEIQHNGKTLSKERTDHKHSKDLIPMGPSAIPWIYNGIAPKEATRDDIKRIVEGWAEAARRTKDAGFDAVEIHGAHGYLLSTFLSPSTNKRTDEYGSSLENRARFACEVLARVRDKVGPAFPIIFRINGSDYLEGGITLEDTLRQAPMFVEAGANALDVSASTMEAPESQFPSYMWPAGSLVYLAEAVKKVVKVPVIAVGKLSDPILANRVLEEGKADFIAMGRGLLADPELPNKAKVGRLDDIRQCIYCNHCLGRGKERFCIVNPALLREKEFIIKPTTSPKKVMVIGGGLAGMEAARVLAERGHQVSLYEKSDKLGGQWNIASQQKFKESYASVTERMTRGLDKAGVKVVLNKEVTAQFVREIRPDAVVVATGASPRTLDVPGADGKNVVQANDVITGKTKVGDSVIVVGGRVVGMEVADFLAEQGKEVSVVTLHRLGENGRPPVVTIYRTLRDRMINHGVRIYPDSPVVEIRDNGVYVVDSQHLVFLKADTVVLAVGAKPDNRLVEELKGVVPEMYAIGDCVEPRDALDATHEGAEIGRKI